MKKKLTSYLLVGIVGLLVFPIFANATTTNSKKTIEGTTYTVIHKAYEYNDLGENGYSYIHGIISPNRFVIDINETGGPEGDEYLFFENGSFREERATSSENIESRKIQWNADYDEYYINEDDSGDENPIVSIRYTHYYLLHNGGKCYLQSADLTAVEGTKYYTYDDDIEEVTTFDPNAADQYVVEVDCDDYSNVLIKTLTDTEVDTIKEYIDTKVESLSGKFNIEPEVYVRPVKGGYIYGVVIYYTDTNIEFPNDDDYKKVSSVYDETLNEIEVLEGATNFGYLKKAGLYFVHYSNKLTIYDTDFNVVYNELVTNLPSDYFYGYDYDENTAFFDFEDGNYMVLTRYVVEEGKNQTFTNKDLTIKFNGDLELLDKVTIDDEVLDAKNYTTAKGSTIITLSKDYLDTLTAGTYTLKATYTDGGEASTTFVIAESESNPKTGDSIMNSLLFGSISLMGLLGASIYLNKKKFY